MASAIEIQIDYTYDTNHFFSAAERRTALEAATSFFEQVLSDTLLEINPANFPGSSWTVEVQNPQTGNTIYLPNYVVPADTIIIFVGSRELGGNVRGLAGSSGWSASGNSSWFARIQGRGNPGAVYSSASAATDYAPHVGFISFDSSTSFNFSTTQSLSGVDFIPIALHEIGHVLGIGISDSWRNLISGSSFTGPASIRAAGGPPSVQSGGGHFDQSVADEPGFGSFERPHGASTPVLMRPSATPNGSLLNVATDLDLAALSDIGWEVTPPLSLALTLLGPGSIQITWPSSSFRNYVIEKSPDLDFSSGIQVNLDGDGSLSSWTDPSATGERAFYQLRDFAYGTSAASFAPASIAATSTGATDPIMTRSIVPRWVEGCGCEEHQ